MRLWRDRAGATAVLVAISMPILLAITGLGVDAGWWYSVRRQNQSAADAAAVSAAWDILQTTGNQVAAANTASAQPQNWYSGTPSLAAGCSGSGSWVCYPYSDSLVTSGVEVVLQQPHNALFASFAPLAGVTIANRAVAMITNLAPACMYLLNPTADKELDIQGSADLYQPTCTICANSTAADSIYAQGGNNSQLTAAQLITAGGIATNGNPVITTSYPSNTGASPCPDPYAPVSDGGSCTGSQCLTHSYLTTGMPTTACGAPTPVTVGTITWYQYPGNCVITNTAHNPNNATLSQGNIILSPNTVFAGGFNIKGQTVDLSPNGAYWIADGDFNLDANAILECAAIGTVTSACVPGAAGVTIILTTAQTSNGTVGNVQVASNATVDPLNAPGSGYFENLLLIQDSNSLPTGTTFTVDSPCKSSCSSFSGNASQVLNGLIYFPDTALNFQGTPAATNSCLLVVANTLTLAGNPSTLEATGCPTSGPGGVTQTKTVVLAE